MHGLHAFSFIIWELLCKRRHAKKSDQITLVTVCLFIRLLYKSKRQPKVVEWSGSQLNLLCQRKDIEKTGISNTAI